MRIAIHHLRPLKAYPRRVENTKEEIRIVSEVTSACVSEVYLPAQMKGGPPLPTITMYPTTVQLYASI